MITLKKGEDFRLFYCENEISLEQLNALMITYSLVCIEEISFAIMRQRMIILFAKVPCYQETSH